MVNTHLFDVGASCSRGNTYIPAPDTIEGDGEIIFVFDTPLWKNQNLPNQPTRRPGLKRDQTRAQKAPDRVHRIGLSLCRENSSSLSPTTPWVWASTTSPCIRAGSESLAIVAASASSNPTATPSGAGRPASAAGSGIDIHGVSCDTVVGSEVAVRSGLGSINVLCEPPRH